MDVEMMQQMGDEEDERMDEMLSDDDPSTAFGA